MSKKVIIVSGGSSGIGKIVCQFLSGEGHVVYDFSRHGKQEGRIKHIDVDVTDEENVKAAVKKVVDEEGHVDILINNAGFGFFGSIEGTDSKMSHQQFEVNMFGADNMVKAVLPYMRDFGKGRIIFTGSLGGVVPLPYQSWYSVSKAALNTYALALSNEVKRFGITVAVIMPGDTATNFTSNRKVSLKYDDVYNGSISECIKKVEHDETNGTNADKVAEIVVKYALKKNSRPLIAIGTSGKCVAVLMKLLPTRFSNWLLGKIYVDL